MNSDLPGTSTNSLAALLKDLREESMTLLRQEVELAKTELNEKTSRVGKGAVKLAIGGFIAYAGLIILLFGLGDLAAIGLVKAGLDADVAVWLGPVLIGLIVALIGWAMVSKAKKAFTANTLVPEETLQSLRENKQWAQTKIQHSHEPAI